MTKKEDMPQPKDFLYLNIENFLEVKEQLKAMKIDCTDKKLSSVLDCNIRTFQKYRSKTNQFPIPRLRLEKLAQYMDVSPLWLCGLDSVSMGSTGWSADQCFLRVLNPTPQRKYLEKYLIAAGIKSERRDLIPSLIAEIEKKDGITDINGHPLSIAQYDKYLEEIESAIKYITSRFIIDFDTPTSHMNPEDFVDIRFQNITHL